MPFSRVGNARLSPVRRTNSYLSFVHSSPGTVEARFGVFRTTILYCKQFFGPLCDGPEFSLLRNVT